MAGPGNDVRSRVRRQESEGRVQRHPARRDNAAAKRFFKRVLRSSPVPRKIVAVQLRSYPAANADIPESVNVKHVVVKAAA